MSAHSKAAKEAKKVKRWRLRRWRLHREELTKHLDHMEAVETADWVHDVQERERQANPGPGKELAEKFKKC
jgi:hypothetical protein